MTSNNINQIMNAISIYVGLTLVAMGLTQMRDSQYVPPETPAGWMMGMAWITSGGIVASTWFLFTLSDVIVQKIHHTKRWTFSSMAISLLVLLLALGCAVLGTWHTWKYPYRLGECLCTDDQWGAFCKPCQCGDHGVCHSGMYGTGVCACDYGWAGAKCDRCDDRHKPEPGELSACTLCKTGFTGDKCQFCATGYTGEDCATCDTGWHPWQFASPLFPDTVADDNRHICDECIPNHWGFYCRPCPLGNDVPRITLARNNPLVIGETRVADKDGRSGQLYLVETCTDVATKECTSWTSGEYDTNDPFILSHVRVKIQYDADDVRSDWLLLTNIGGFQCNNRGTCRDDVWHQENNPDWDKTCTKSTVQECTVHSDCKTSENCKGFCAPLELPVNPFWSKWNGDPGQMCATDTDCQGEPIDEDEDGTLIYYTGGRCINRFCCDESYHGDGTCDCNADFFGPSFGPGIKPHQELSPACDFCPGYDWLTEETTTICSGAKGTCAPSYTSAVDANQEYIDMRCICGETVYIDPDTGIADPTIVITWKGEFCECGDSDLDGECNFCAAGHWGPECKMCPGGAGERACSGHGICSSGPLGDGSCLCDVDKTSSWMLADYVERYPGDCKACAAADGDTRTCNECAPNFWGEGCWRCDDTDMIKASELDDIFQPQGSFHLGIGQSSAEPHAVCHPQQPWLCTLACGGGGWCDWGRQGTGSCSCWYNIRAAEETWNPLDNVCIGTHRYDPSGNQTFEQAIKTGAVNDGIFVEQCPAYGYCENGGRSREMCSETSTAQCDDKFIPCGPDVYIGGNKNMSIPKRLDLRNNLPWMAWNNWADATATTDDCSLSLGECFVHRTINWQHSNSGITCKAD